MFKIICLLTFIFSGAVYSDLELAATADQGSAHSENANSPETLPNDLSQRLIEPIEPVRSYSAPSFKQLKEALESGSYADVKNLIEAFDMSDFGWILRKAARYGRLDVVHFLVIDKRVDVNARSGYGVTPLMSAAGGGHLDIVQFLVANGADVNARSEYGSTPLMSAVRVGDLDVVHFLIAKGAYMNVQDKGGRTALMSAAGSRSYYIAQSLIEAGANMDATDNEGRTALTIAQDNNDEDMVNLLIQAGAKQQFRPWLFLKGLF